MTGNAAADHVARPRAGAAVLRGHRSRRARSGPSRGVVPWPGTGDGRRSAYWSAVGRKR